MRGAERSSTDKPGFRNLATKQQRKGGLRSDRRERKVRLDQLTISIGGEGHKAQRWL